MAFFISGVKEQKIKNDFLLHAVDKDGAYTAPIFYVNLFSSTTKGIHFPLLSMLENKISDNHRCNNKLSDSCSFI